MEDFIFSMFKIKYLTVASLVLQEILKSRMYDKFGSKWFDVLTGHIYDMADDDTDNHSSYKDIVERADGGEISLPQFDVTACLPIIRHFELLESALEIHLVNRARELRNIACHEVDTSKSNDEAVESDEAFWFSAKKLFKEMSETFELGERVKKEFEKYSSTEFLALEKAVTDVDLFGQANELIDSGEEKEGYALISTLANRRYDKAFLRLSELHRQDTLSFLPFDIDKAIFYAESALSIGGENASIILNTLKDIKRILNGSENSADDWLNLVSIAKQGIYLPKKWSFFYPLYEKAEKAGWTEMNKTLLCDADESWQTQALRALGKRGEIDMIKDYLAGKSDEKAKKIISELPSGNKEVWITLLQGELKEKCFKDDTGFEKRYKAELNEIYDRHETEKPAHFGRVCFALASFEYDRYKEPGALAKAITLDAEGSSDGYQDCTQRLGEWFDKFRNLTSADLEKSYIHESLPSLPQSLQQIVADSFWQEKLETLRKDKTNIKTQIKYILNGDEFDAFDEPVTIKTLSRLESVLCQNSDKLTCPSEKKEEFFEEYNKLIEICQKETDDEKARLYREKIDKRIEQYAEHFGERDRKEFWENDKVFSDYVSALERKQKYSVYMGEQTWEYWLNIRQVVKDVQPFKNKAQYEKLLGQQPWEYWCNSPQVQADVTAVTNRNKYEKILGENPMAYWQNTAQVEADVNAWDNKRRYESLIGEKSKSFWHDDSRVMAEVRAFENKEKHEKTLGKRSMEYWRDDKQVEKDLIIASDKETYGAILGEKNDEFWADSRMVRACVETIKNRKNKYCHIFGEQGWDFWRDGENIEKQLEICKKRQEKYEKLLSNNSLEFWYDTDKIAEALRDKYESVLGEQDISFWKNLSNVKKMLECYDSFCEELKRAEKSTNRSNSKIGFISNRKFFEEEFVKNTIVCIFKDKLGPNKLGYLTDACWLNQYLKAYDRFCKYAEMVNYKNWSDKDRETKEDGDIWYGEIQPRYSKDWTAEDINWEFWMNEELVKKEYHSFSLFKKYGPYKRKPRSFWKDDNPEVRKIIKEYDKEEKRRIARRKRRNAISSITDVLLYLPKLLLNVLVNHFLPKYLSLSAIGISLAWVGLSAIFSLVAFVVIALPLSLINEALVSNETSFLVLPFIAYQIVAGGELVTLTRVIVKKNIAYSCIETLKLFVLGAILLATWGTGLYDGFVADVTSDETKLWWGILTVIITQSIPTFIIYLRNMDD